MVKKYFYETHVHDFNISNVNIRNNDLPKGGINNYNYN